MVSIFFKCDFEDDNMPDNFYTKTEFVSHILSEIFDLEFDDAKKSIFFGHTTNENLQLQQRLKNNFFREQ